MDIQRLIQEIEGTESKERKAVSLAETEIYNDEIYPHVEAYLRKFYSQKTINEMPFMACVNLAKRIVDQEASLYRMSPVRTFDGLSESNLATIQQVYQDMKVDQMMLRSNRMFKLQSQNHFQVLPYKNKLMMRVLLNHHIDAIPDPANPEIALGYVISGFDKSFLYNNVRRTDATNQKIADRDDYKDGTKKYSLWTEQINTVVNTQGQPQTEETENPLGLIPIIEVSTYKDFEYWVRRGTAVTDFTIQFNATMSDVAHIVRMQGFAQAFLISSSDAMPDNIQIGPNFVLKLPVDPNNPVAPQFGFANPNPDLQGSLKFPETLLSSFLSSRGLSPKLVSGSGEGDKYTSGLDRLLSMIERFEASQYDIEVYKNAEMQLLKVVIAYLNTYAGKQDGLQYSWTNVNPESVSMTVKFSEPQMIMSESEKLDAIRSKKELMLLSDLDAVKEYYGLTDEQAQVKLNEIQGAVIGETTV